MNNNEFEYSEKTKRRVRIFKKRKDTIKRKCKKRKDARSLVFLIITIYCDEYCFNLTKTVKEICKL